jgi:hypothetical protein
LKRNAAASNAARVTRLSPTRRTLRRWVVHVH